MLRNRPRAVAAWLSVLAWMLAIFAGSTDILSGRHTAALLRPFLHWLKPDLSEDAVQTIQWTLRKMGHLTEFAVLALLLQRAFRLQLGAERSRWSWRTAGLSLALACLYAATDEFHQSFVPTRTASAIDVLIDTTGAAMALLLARFWIDKTVQVESDSAAP